MFASTIQYQNLVAVIESLAYMARGWGWGREVPGSILCSKKKRYLLKGEKRKSGNSVAIIRIAVNTYKHI